MPDLKPGVVLYALHPKLDAALAAIDNVFACTVKRPALITAARDGLHKCGSRHYQGRALDLRSKDLSEAQKDTVTQKLKTALGSDFDVLLENRGLVNEHIHIEAEVV